MNGKAHVICLQALGEHCWLYKKMDGRVDEIEKQALIRGQKIAFVKRLFWMVVTDAVGLAFVFLR